MRCCVGLASENRWLCANLVPPDCPRFGEYQLIPDVLEEQMSDMTLILHVHDLVVGSQSGVQA